MSSPHICGLPAPSRVSLSNAVPQALAIRAVSLEDEREAAYIPVPTRSRTDCGDFSLLMRLRCLSVLRPDETLYPVLRRDVRS
jgi:hypothetical protein